MDIEGVTYYYYYDDKFCKLILCVGRRFLLSLVIPSSCKRFRLKSYLPRPTSWPQLKPSINNQQKKNNIYISISTSQIYHIILKMITMLLLSLTGILTAAIINQLSQKYALVLQVLPPFKTNFIYTSLFCNKIKFKI